MGIERKNIYRFKIIPSKDLSLIQQIKLVHKTHSAYGYRRVAWELGINPKRSQRVMKLFQIRAPRRKTKHWCTRSTDHHNYSNIIQDIVPSRANEIWFSDVSYLKFQGRFWYLATIVDMLTRKVVAAQVHKHHDRWLVLSTIKQAIKQAVPKFFHTDQGTEFMARICTNFLEANGVKVSVSKKASPWQNGFQESFFGRFKDEFGDINRFETVGELIEEIYHQIDYYNYRRIHTALKMPPAVYAKQLSERCHQKWGA